MPCCWIRGLYPIIDTAACARAEVDPRRLAKALVQGGVAVAQYRHKGPYTREILAQAEEIGGLLRQAGVRYVINDRADVALAVRADGVHVGQEDLPPASVRALVGPEVCVGYSTHNEVQLRASGREPVDYVALGPVFATGSKENPDAVVGVGELARLRLLTSRPLVAIGGITRANAREVLAAGADAIAVISDLLGDDLEGRVREWVGLTGR
jgi:thiamine-phosphate pyrophosphorylase